MTDDNVVIDIGLIREEKTREVKGIFLRIKQDGEDASVALSVDNAEDFANHILESVKRAREPVT